MTLDALGAVVSVTVTESRFSPDDKALLLAARRARDVPRDSNGVLLADAIDPANQFRFEVPPPTTNFAKKALDDAQSAWEKEYGDRAGMGSLLWNVKLKD